MDADEVVCVHMNLKFLIFKNIEKNEDNYLCNDFIIDLADVEDIESSNISKGYFIKKFHEFLKKKKKNEYECVINGTITEVANFFFQNIELFIKIKKIQYELEDKNCEPNKYDNNREGTNTDYTFVNKDFGINKNIINLIKSADMQNDFNFENNDNIYFKCLFKDLINNFEFIENKQYENISNFYISNNLIFSINLKFEEYSINKKYIESTKKTNWLDNSYLARYPNNENGKNIRNMNNNIYTEKTENKINHILNIFNFKNIFFLYINFDQYKKEFFIDNDVEVSVGNIVHSITPNSCINENDQEELNNQLDDNHDTDHINNDRFSDHMDNKNTVGCHFSLIFVDKIKEINDYFLINDIFVYVNKMQLEVDKRSLLQNNNDNENYINKKKEAWENYSDFRQISYDLVTSSNSMPNLKFKATIISFPLYSNYNNAKSDSDDNYNFTNVQHDMATSDSHDIMSYNKIPHIDEDNNQIYSFGRGHKNDEKYFGIHNRANNITGNLGLPITLDKNDNKIFCNIFLSAINCHILELSNIYAEKNKNKQNNFFIKMESNIMGNSFVSPLYIFEENKKIELKNCHLDCDVELKESELLSYFENKKILFELSIKEQDNNINIGKGEFNIKNVVKELKEALENENSKGYYKQKLNISLYLSVFKEKYLTSEINAEIYFSIKEKKEKMAEKMMENRLGVYENVIHNPVINEWNSETGNIPSNIYEFKLWKEREEKLMKEILKKKENNLIKKFTKKYEQMEKERKNEFEIKKNKVKEIIIKMKEDEINILNSRNELKLKDQELNSEISNIENKLKQIKIAYEKSLSNFKKSIRHNNLSSSILEENNTLKTSYKKLKNDIKNLKKENDHMKEMLSKYNNKDNTIISNKYFQELKEAKNEDKTEDGKNQHTSQIENYIKNIKKNRKHMLKLLTNFVLNFEYIYDQTCNEKLEDNFHSLLKIVNQLKTIINKEIKNDNILVSDFENTMENESDSYLKTNVEQDKTRHIENDGNKLEKDKGVINKYYNKTNYFTELKKKETFYDSNDDENQNSNYRFTKLIPKREKKNNDEIKPNVVEDSNPIVNVNKAKIAENLKSEINRLIQNGIYNENDQIIINMKKKLNSLILDT
ncbi:Cg7 protein, putative [Plasmodium chabaudi chabaudi]|uniref:Cg7 protein, putative n=1 Tax=Plasmodium chabaudi chabaudi TaxID=31271 RepID=A0A1D3S0Z7_PLACU|nr:Cg7 protein, putative [Plasmodium chabaudi chabaudi]